MNVNVLKSKITDYAEKLIDDYFKQKTNIFLQTLSRQYDIEYNDLLELYASTYNHRITHKNQCQALTKNNITCSHKCIEGSQYCKKHMKISTHETSYFPEDNSENIV